jgi:hypothetical protein
MWAPSTIASILPEISEHTEFNGAGKVFDPQKPRPSSIILSGASTCDIKIRLREFTEFEQGSFL